MDGRGVGADSRPAHGGAVKNRAGSSLGEGRNSKCQKKAPLAQPRPWCLKSRRLTTDSIPGKERAWGQCDVHGESRSRELTPQQEGKEKCSGQVKRDKSPDYT